MAARTVTVKSADGDYTSLNAALSGESADLVTNTRLLTIETYAFEDTTDADTGTGYTVSSSYYIKITSPESERHAGVWSTSKSRHKSTTGTLLTVQAAYTIVEWQQIDNAYTGANDALGIKLADNLSNCTIRYCIIRKTGTPSAGYSIGVYFFVNSNVSQSVYIYRNIVYGFSSGGTYNFGICVDASTSYANPSTIINNNTVYLCDANIIQWDYDGLTLKNNFCGGGASFDYYLSGATPTHSKNISSDSTSPDGASYQGKTAYSNYFQDYANKDFRTRPIMSNILLRAGDNLGSPYNIDITGETVSGAWTIGADDTNATSGTVTVKSSGGDYSTLNAALSGESGDLVTKTIQINIETYAFEDTTDADTGTGYTVSSSYYIKITSPESERHAGVWSSAKARHKITSYSGTGNFGIVIQENYTIIEWQQQDVSPPSAGSSSDEMIGIGVVDANFCTVRYCIVRKTGVAFNGNIIGILFYAAVDPPDSEGYCYRNIAYDMVAATDGYGILLNGYTSDSGNIDFYLHNNTIYNCSSAGFNIGYYTYLTAKNNFAGGCGDDYLASNFGGVTTSKNITSDATSPDGASYQGKTAYSNYFVDYTNKDFHLKSTDTVLKDAGDNLGSPYDTDIDGETVTGTWDIGADEYISSVIAGTTCWGHSTGVTETNTRTFASNWTGTGSIENSGDSENLVLSDGEYMESEIIQTGSETITVTYNYYATGDSITVKYRTAATSAGITGESWSTYSTPFASSGYIQLRLEG